MPGNQNSATNVRNDPNVDPGPVNPPGIIEPAASFTAGIPQLWVAASGGADWGGCIVNVSFDGGTTYKDIGVITQPALQGVLTAGITYVADPDTTNTLGIDLTQSAGIMPTSATHADADALRTLALISDAFTTTVPSTGEMIAYGTAAATGLYTSDLTYLRRGVLGTVDRGHSIGAFFTRFDLSELGLPTNSALIWNLPPQYIGASLVLKLQSFNNFGNALEDISTVTAYSYTPSGGGYGGGSGSVPTTPTGFAGYARGTSGNGYNQLLWNANPLADIVQYYTVQRRVHSIGSYTTIGTTANTIFYDNSAATGIQYDYQLTAHNANGDSSAAGPVTITTN
ncbi:MAG TPA: hypothetical protein VKR31_00890 [Rhizomicrobium sp.]|nr:hypothetical protein [Rhizomicrobium sp.]